jgi:hypothetical protein
MNRHPIAAILVFAALMVSCDSELRTVHLETEPVDRIESSAFGPVHFTIETVEDQVIYRARGGGVNLFDLPPVTFVVPASGNSATVLYLTGTVDGGGAGEIIYSYSILSSMLGGAIATPVSLGESRFFLEENPPSYRQNYARLSIPLTLIPGDLITVIPNAFQMGGSTDVTFTLDLAALKQPPPRNRRRHK